MCVYPGILYIYRSVFVNTHSYFRLHHVALHHAASHDAASCLTPSNHIKP